MRITYIKGDLLRSGERVIAHGCNAQGVMRSGVAKAIRERYPEVYDDYMAVYAKHGFYNLGQVIETISDDRIIFSIISQQHYGRNNIRYVSYDAIVKAIETINLRKMRRVAFPLIGAGLANGNWKVISTIIETYSNFSPVVYYFDEAEDIVRDAQT